MSLKVLKGNRPRRLDAPGIPWKRLSAAEKQMRQRTSASSGIEGVWKERPGKRR